MVLVMKILLYQIREQRNLTLRQLSEASGVSKTEINLIENGKVMPKIDVICKLAKALDIRAWDLFDCDQ